MSKRIISFFSSVDSIVADINQKVKRLRDLQDDRLQRAEGIEDQVDELLKTARSHREEANRAAKLATRFEQLVA